MFVNIADSTERILNLQGMLRYLSFTQDSPALRVNVTGFYNKETEQAVRQFQQTRGLPVTGITDLATWDAIASEYRQGQDQRRPVLLRPLPDNILQQNSLGERSDIVLLLQIILNSLRLIYAYPAVPLSGVYGSQTADAVRLFQQVNGLTPTGTADRSTWLLLSDEYRWENE